MNEEELNARVNAMHGEYQLHIGALTKRATELAAELTSSAFREQASRKHIEELEAKIPKET